MNKHQTGSCAANIVQIDLYQKDCNIPIAERDSDDTAIVVLSSGTTGVPKAILLANKHIIGKGTLSRKQCKKFGPSVLHFNQFWPARMIDIFVEGETLHIFNPKITSLVSLPEYLQKNQITLIVAFTAIIEQMNINFQSGEIKLKAIFLTGEKLSENAVRNLQNHYQSDVVIIHSYGASETGPVSFHTSKIKDYDSNNKKNLVLRADQLLILNQDGQQVKRGVTGEIVVVNDSLPTGYLNNKKLSKEKFRTIQPGNKRTFFTGDLGYLDDDNHLILMGRKDNYIKVNGFLVNEDEVEKLLLENFNMSDVAVVGYAEKNQQTKLYCFYTSDEHFDYKMMRKTMRNFAPSYMIPKQFQRFQMLPKTASGKIQKNILKDFINQRNQISIEENEDELTAIVRECYIKILGHNDFHFDDSFFDLGGDSMSALSLIMEIETQQKVTLSYDDFLFSGASLNALTKLLKNKSDQSVELIPLNNAHGNCLIYVIPPLRGHFSDYFELSKALEPEIKLIGVKIDDFFKDTQIALNDILRKATTSLSKQYEENKIHILGFSSGGLLAYEIVNFLEIENVTVDSLLLLDSKIREEKRRIPPKLVWLSLKIKSQIRNQRGKYVENVDTLQFFSSRYELSQRTPNKNLKVKKPILLAAEGGILSDYRIIQRWQKAFMNKLNIDHYPGSHLSLREKSTAEVLANKIKTTILE